VPSNDISRRYARSFSLSLSFSLVFFSLRPIAFSSSLHANFISLRCGHYIAIIKLCRKPAVVILAVYCAQRSHVQEETIIFDRVHCVQCITQSRPVTDGRIRSLAHPRLRAKRRWRWLVVPSDMLPRIIRLD